MYLRMPKHNTLILKTQVRERLQPYAVRIHGCAAHDENKNGGAIRNLWRSGFVRCLCNSIIFTEITGKTSLQKRKAIGDYIVSNGMCLQAAPSEKKVPSTDKNVENRPYIRPLRAEKSC